MRRQTSILKASKPYREACPPEFAWETNDCVVRSLAVVTGRPYVEVHALLKQHGRPDGKGTPWPTIRAACEELGMVRHIPGLRLSPKEDRFLRPTLRQWLDLPGHSRGRWMVCRVGHAFAVVNGVVFDWVYGTGARSRIDDAYKLEA
jgi:hypothetical protein